MEIKFAAFFKVSCQFFDFIANFNTMFKKSQELKFSILLNNAFKYEAINNEGISARGLHGPHFSGPGQYWCKFSRIQFIDKIRVSFGFSH